MQGLRFDSLKKFYKNLFLSPFLNISIPLTAKFIFKLLSYEGALTQKEIIAETNLPGRTVRHALDCLLKN